ncbi:MAG: cob(I)yrinic acid a,c-diamide adenosyltransferase [Acidobacteria bacterium]|nr:cob(I)yrinic acid a,c-diamide adenosyltransferase [Acidobacteriota bacterium]
MKIYTRTGDRGQTSLVGGTRVSKCDPRVEAYGDVDELNATLGLVAAESLDADLDEVLVRLQTDLFAIGARLADPGDRLGDRVPKAAVEPSDVERLESWIDRLDSELQPLKRFILPGGSRTGALLHLARTVCRRAERRIVALDSPVSAEVLAYLNRASDLLFVMARVVNRRAGKSEIEW